MFPVLPLTSLSAFCLLSIATGGALPAQDAPLFTPATAVATGELTPGTAIPALELQTQDGRVKNVQDFRGDALAITFIYRRCVSATLCPMVSRNFDVTQGLLQKLGAGSHCHLLTLTLDPEHDTPAALAEYASAAQADPALWTFGVAPEAQVRQFGKAFGLEFRRVGDQIDHNLRVAVIDRQGRLQHIFRGNSWTPQELLAELRAAARH